MTATQTTRTFHCARCQIDYETESPVEEVQKEFEQNLPGDTNDETVSLCDDCYDFAMAWIAEHGMPERP